MLPGKLTFLLNGVSDCGLCQHPESPGSWEVLLCFLAGSLKCFDLCWVWQHFQIMARVQLHSERVPSPFPRVY